MVTSRRGLGDWVEPLSTEVPQIPAQPAAQTLDSYSPLSELLCMPREGWVQRW